MQEKETATTISSVTKRYRTESEFLTLVYHELSDLNVLLSIKWSGMDLFYPIEQLAQDF